MNFEYDYKPCCLLDVSTSIIYDLETSDLSGLEEDYTVKNYYRSVSGLSGAFNIHSKNKPVSNLMELGYSLKKHQGYKNIYLQYSKLFIYVLNKTAGTHEGFNHDCYVVVTDGRRVYFSETHYDETNRTLTLCSIPSNWNKFWEDEDIDPSFEYREITIPIYTMENDIELKIKTYNIPRGINILKFIDLRKYKDDYKFENELDEKINCIYSKGRLYHLSSLGILDFRGSHLEIASKSGYNLKFFNELTVLIKVISENGIPCQKYVQFWRKGEEKYGNSNDFFEYEFEVGLFEKEKNLLEEARKNLRKKIKMDWIRREKQKFSDNDCFVNILITKIQRLNWEDSTSVGNCIYGSKNFAERYNLKVQNDGSKEEEYDEIFDFIEMEDIRNNARLREMIKNSGFKNVIFSKIFS